MITTKHLVNFLDSKQGKELLAKHKLRLSWGPLRSTAALIGTYVTVHEKGARGLFRPLASYWVQEGAIHGYIEQVGHSEPKCTRARAFAREVARHMGLEHGAMSHLCQL